MPTEVADAQIEESLKLCTLYSRPGGCMPTSMFLRAARTGWPATLEALKAAREQIKELEYRLTVNRDAVKELRGE